MTKEQATAAWAAKCRMAESLGFSAGRNILETELLLAMHEAVELRAKLAKLTEKPDPKRGLTRAHGLHLMNEVGALIPVDADYSVDDDEGVQVEFVWIGSHDVAGMFWASHAERLAEQITARIKEDAAEIRAELKAAA